MRRRAAPRVTWASVPEDEPTASFGASYLTAAALVLATDPATVARNSTAAYTAPPSYWSLSSSRRRGQGWPEAIGEADAKRSAVDAAGAAWTMIGRGSGSDSCVTCGPRWGPLSAGAGPLMGRRSPRSRSPKTSAPGDREGCRCRGVRRSPGDRRDVGEGAAGVPGGERPYQPGRAVELDAAVAGGLRPGLLTGVPLDEGLGFRGDVEVLVESRVGLADLGVPALDQQPVALAAGSAGERRRWRRATSTSRARCAVMWRSA